MVGKAMGGVIPDYRVPFSCNLHLLLHQKFYDLPSQLDVSYPPSPICAQGGKIFNDFHSTPPSLVRKSTLRPLFSFRIHYKDSEESVNQEVWSH